MFTTGVSAQTRYMHSWCPAQCCPANLQAWGNTRMGTDPLLCVWLCMQRSTERNVRDLLMSWGWRLPQLTLNILMGATMEMGQCGTSRMFVLLRQCELGQLLDSGALKGGDRRLCNLPRAQKPHRLTAQSSGQRALQAAYLYNLFIMPLKKPPVASAPAEQRACLSC